MVQTILAALGLGLIFWTYAGYPLVQRMFPGRPLQRSSNPERRPTVSVVFAAYNEVGVIEEKIRSIFKTTYPAELLEVRIGSDLSNDGQDEKIRELQ